MTSDAVQKPHDQLAAFLADDMAAVGTLIADRMASEHAPRIPEVTAHLVGAGGKRLRPMLTLAAARMCGYDGPYHIHLAATVEFIHTATLLHDDVVDESAQRRGRPTANLLWDNKSSVLVGDYLFARSFQLAATEVGGVIAGANPEMIKGLFDYGDALGIAFQIVDDLLDYQGQTDATGKNIGDDFRERKLTLPVIKAVALADAEQRAFWTRTIEKGQQEDGDLDHALALMHQHGTLAQTQSEALEWAAKAKASLDAVPDHALKSMLVDLADYVVSRIS